ncbi:glycosyltransferase family 8 protein [Agrobacterium larrymoorei]|uniref:Glycosyltransferase family 8 protein n=1 Tax=Agrobacterium larrymoorei TaxID=160699 RepID=A0AAF0HCS5_9HYPH|nr:glycosyltransferase family 8 protein [Agrobacterium larrymoorei]WHA42024.1 glycosyltransferase family 8 protein [Agrobacterium larrymoorei]
MAVSDDFHRGEIDFRTRSFVATIIDRNFVELAGVMLRSLVLNGDIGDAEIVVVGEKLRKRDKQKLESCAYPLKLHLIDLTQSSMSNFDNLPTNSNWSKTVYARLLLPNLLPKTSCRVLYIDADVLVLKSLRPLLELDMDGHPLAASGGLDPSTSERLKLSPKVKTLNSGVLLFDIDAWKQKSLSQRCLEVAFEHVRLLKFFDQDVLNMALEGNFLSIPQRWNDFGYGDLSDTAVLHFTRDKPNSVRCSHPAKNLYLEYRQSTPWANKPLQSRWHKRFKRLGFSIKRTLGLA